MFLYLALVSLLCPRAISKSKVNDVLSDQDHHPRGEHNPEFDHAAFLGKDTAKTFDTLPPDESKERLGEIFHKVDEQILADGLVTEEELKKWIQHTKTRYNYEDTIKQVKNNDIDKDGSITWDEYKNITYAFLEENDSENEYHIESLRHDEKRFKSADQEGDMKLSINEFSAFLHPEDHEHMTANMVNETIEDIDKDNDGLISLEEYLGDLWTEGDNINEGEGEPDWLKTEERKKFTEFHDKNEDGKMDAQEVKEWILPRDYVISEAKHLISESDANGDGKISKEEMIEKYELFVGSQVTNFGDIINSHEEL